MKIENEYFILELIPKIDEEEINNIVNTEISVYVKSNDFTAKSIFEINIRELAQFSYDMQKIYNQLNGKSVIKEPYGDNYIEFEVIKNGYILVKGSINEIDKNGNKNVLHFENKIDQTCIKEFSNELYNNYAKYLLLKINDMFSDK